MYMCIYSQIEHVLLRTSWFTVFLFPVAIVNSPEECGKRCLPHETNLEWINSYAVTRVAFPITVLLYLGIEPSVRIRFYIYAYVYIHSFFLFIIYSAHCGLSDLISVSRCYSFGSYRLGWSFVLWSRPMYVLMMCSADYIDLSFAGVLISKEAVTLFDTHELLKTTLCPLLCFALFGLNDNI